MTHPLPYPLLCHLLLLRKFATLLYPGCSVVKPRIVICEPLYFAEKDRRTSRDQRSTHINRWSSFMYWKWKFVPELLIEQTFLFKSGQLLPNLLLLSDLYGVDHFSLQRLLLCAKFWVIAKFVWTKCEKRRFVNVKSFQLHLSHLFWTHSSQGASDPV